MNISLDQAKAFCTTVDQGGYVKASHKLRKSHSALIYLIKSLEQQCGFALFNRKEYRNTLTPSGQRVYQKCLEILSKVDELDTLCGQFQKGWEPSLKIVIDGILPFEPFLALYKKFRAEKIPTTIQTYTDFLDGVEKSYDHLGADIMVSVLPIQNRELKPIYLKPQKTYLVAHKDHLIHQSTKKWSVHDLEKFDFLTIRGSGPALGLNTGEFEKSASFFLSDFSVKKDAIIKKTGFGWLPQHLIEKELQTKTLRPIKWERESVKVLQPIFYMNSQKMNGPASQMIIESLQQL
jgi:DNA-binding transcriptional LysR family regulator